MLIGDTYKIEAEKFNVVLSKRRHSEKNQTSVWEPEAYFSTVPDALKYIVTLEVEETGLKDLKTVVDAIDKISAKIDKAFSDQSSNVPHQCKCNGSTIPCHKA